MSSDVGRPPLPVRLHGVMTVKEVALAYQVSPRTVRRLYHRRLLRGSKIGYRSIRIYRHSAAQYFAQHENT